MFTCGEEVTVERGLPDGWDDWLDYLVGSDVVGEGVDTGDVD